MMFKLSVFLVFVFIHLTSGQKPKLPDVLVEVLTPKGVRFSVPDSPEIGGFAILTNVSIPIESVGIVESSINGRWVYEDLTMKIRPRDVLIYVVYLLFNGIDYFDVFRFDVPDFIECRMGETTVNNRPACVGNTIFYESFDTLSTDAWQIEHKIAFDHPEYPFISYQKSAVSVKNGQLFIKPSLQQDKPSFNEESIYAGKLDLISWCTGQPLTCQMTASGVNILPPVVTGRITSKAFSFRYGLVEIRAMMPQGDWLYPEILLQPFSYQYGTEEYASGLFKIATARGNSEILDAGSDIGNKVLYGGPIIEKECRDALIVTKKESNKKWGDDFHNYTMKWTSDSIVLSVDNEEWATYTPNNTLLALLPASCQNYSNRFTYGSKMAPFDEEFVLSLGLAAGGITEFSDSTRSKPWKNSASKAKLHFWQHLNTWYPTWGEKSTFVIDYVKITAL